jgi:hypothetical protein
MLMRVLVSFSGRCCLILASLAIAAAQPSVPSQCQRLIVANVAALEQPIWFNRLGAMLPEGMIYALQSDVVPMTNGVPAAGGPSCAAPGANCKAGQVGLRPDKRPRPMVLRANVGDCLQIVFTNYIESNPAPLTLPIGQTLTRTAGIHVTGMELVNGIASDSSNVGKNSNSLEVAVPTGSTPAPQTYTYYAKTEGNFLLYSFDDGDPGQWASGLFGAVNVQPADAEWYRSQVTHQDLQNSTYNADHLPPNMTLKAVTDASGQQVKTNVNGVQQDLFSLTTELLEPAPDRHTTTTAYVFVCAANGAGGCTPRNIYTLSGHPVVNYDAADSASKPILSMLKPVNLPRRQPGVAQAPTGEIQYTDLTALITGPYADRFPYDQNGSEFHNNPALPDRRQPYREFSIFYHVNNQIVQAFPQYYPSPGSAAIAQTMGNAPDTFAINYGTGGIGSEILANRLGVGPEANCVECKFEEFFLSSWVVGDPAMVVSSGANKAAMYPDDPSNVYHSYLKDHVKFRIFNTSPTQQHVHHQHAHQWLHTANDDDSTYLDSQLIIPGAAYTLDMVYNGSGNRNGTIGDSIFHCHFYPHFAAGMWSLWRVHDVFEDGTMMAPSAPGAPSLPVQCAASDNNCFNRALPDGEIAAGTPIPALVPLPTLGMAPLPSKVKLVDNGTRTFVQPEATPTAEAGTMMFSDPNGTLAYKNPGYPFFVPGIAGHRAPHPPLDFAWKVDAQGKPVLDANGKKIPLDGGLPRHLVLGGQFVNEFHTGWDFSKDFTSPAGGGTGPNVKIGLMTATVLPEDGTAVERSAMSSQSQRTQPTYTPDGLPGNFTKNGLPPAPGAPFAPPQVDDNGNNVNNVRVYRAAVVQRDVVLNKEGWHYPQQRMLTLWQDVDPTMNGARPPQPLFIRANTGETVEFWHTNLVPSYYDLDDFQVRTPTDVIGQHIHLVKFDVLASDGAANGFNYEDGTFSPEEVRERITVMDNTGPGKGIYNYNPACWSATSLLLSCVQGSPQTNLTPVTVAAAGYPFTDSHGEWAGAQTTIQRWDTDPLLDNNGRDRTMRTVFTHDHFGPSTHQQIGLYAGLLIEPDNSQWFESETGAKMYTRTDGGPTNWAAVIQTANPADSYREFMVEYQDSQFAYSSLSKSAKATPPASLTQFPIGNISSVLQTNFPTCMQTTFPGWSNGCPLGTASSSFNPATCSTACCLMRLNFCSNGIVLSPQATVSGSSPTWTISDHGGAMTFSITGGTSQTASVNNVPAAWYDPVNAISPQYPGGKPNTNRPAPPVNIISSIDSSATPGTYSVNYRNEPVTLRVTQPGSNQSQPRTQAAGKVGDLSYAFASMPNRADSVLVVQPDNGAKIANSGWSFPGCPLSPTVLPGGTDTACPDATVSQWAAACAGPSAGPSCVQPSDPYTPMMRAYQGDRVQIRTLVGAHVRTHPIMLRGLKWLTEPSSVDSGYRSNQASGLSEHFELVFRVPFSRMSSVTSAADYLYHASASLTGSANGTWGLLRAFDSKAQPIGLLKLPPQAVPPAPATAPDACPADAPIVHYNVVVTDGKNLPNNAITYNTRPIAGHTFNANAGGTGTPAYTFTGGNNNPHAILYVLEENLGKLASGALAPEPLILRAKAGDCITVTLKNGLPQLLLGDPGILTRTNPSPFWLSPFGASNNYNGVAAAAPLGPLYPGLNLSTSTAAGMSPQLVSYDITQSAGFSIGFNPDQLTQPMPTQPNPGVAPDCNASPASCKTYTWYAGNRTVQDGKTVGAPMELGAANLLPSDALLQEPLGLYGALIVEPRGATWTTDGGTSAAATVTHPVTGADGVTRTESFREFVAIAQDDAYVNKTLVQGAGAQASAPAAKPARGGEAGNQISNRLAVARANPGGTSLTANLFNYRSEPVDARYQASGTFMDLTNFYSNSQVNNQDPQTPIFTASASNQVRFRMLRPGQDDDIVMTIHGHSWQEAPWMNSSRQMGFNRLSNTFGTQQMSGNDKLEMMIGDAGGRFHVAGDYLYNGVLQAVNPQNLGGMWGIMRVSADAVNINQAQFTPAGLGSGSTMGALTVAGNVSKAVGTGSTATMVEIFTVTDLSSACSLTIRPCAQKLGEAAVQPDGSWRFVASGITMEGGAFIRAVTNLASPWPAQASSNVTIRAPRDPGSTNN